MKKRGTITVQVTTAAVPPIDLDKWMREYIALVMELENVNVASPPSARLG